MSPIPRVSRGAARRAGRNAGGGNQRQFSRPFSKAAELKLRILGCGTSSGVPRIGSDWGDCDPDEPKNRRRRVSILVEQNETRILVDTGPDLREQLLDAGVASLDAVLWTHDHADHCHGIDELRQLYHKRGAPVPGFARDDTLASLKQRFDYVFEGKGGYPAVVEACPLPDRLSIGDIALSIVEQPTAPLPRRDPLRRGRRVDRIFNRFQRDDT